MSCYSQANKQRRKTPEYTVAMCCFLVFGSSLKTESTDRTEHQQTITGRGNQIQALEFTNEAHQQKKF